MAGTAKVSMAVINILVTAAVLCPSLHSTACSAQVVDAGSIQQYRRHLLQQQQQGSAPRTPTSSADCGGPYMLCGLSIPKGITCPQGPGYCQKGFYCGQSKLSLESQCLPVPADCGQVGKPCCPSNTLSPNTKEADVFRPAFCKDGAVCFSWSQLGTIKDFYKGRTGAYPCAAVPAGCGSAAGKSCCPTLYRLSTNPQLEKQGCWGAVSGSTLYCKYEDPGPNAELAFIPGTCVVNPPDCGTLGRPCCVATTSSSNAVSCKSEPGGSELYCDMKGNNTCKLCPTNPTAANSWADCRSD